MPREQAGKRTKRLRRRLGQRLPWAFVLAGCACNAAMADELAPTLSPDRIEDAPSTRLDPYPTFDNFAWRAFLALNWPARPGADGRGEPDRGKTLGDPGPRVWETFKSSYELFQVGPDGRPIAPSAYASFEGRNPCGDGFDNRTKTLASFVPYAEFNQPGFAPREFLNPLVAQNHTYTRYEIRLNRPEYEAIAASGWSVGRNLPDAAHPADLPIGSIAVKASWRILTDADTPAVRARYYVVRDANVVDVAKSLAAGEDRLLEERHRPGRHAHHGQDALSAAMAVEHVRACRQRAARRRRRGARARRKRRRRALFLFRSDPARSATASRSVRPRPSRSAWPIPPSSTPSRCRSPAAIPSMPRRWR